MVLEDELIAMTPVKEFKHITIISYRKRLLDYENLVFGIKPINDGLKKLGVYIR